MPDGRQRKLRHNAADHGSPPVLQTAIPCTLMRGGTSKGAYFLDRDLPADVADARPRPAGGLGFARRRQIDGVGGADPLTSKVAIVGRSQRPGIDVDFLFAQVSWTKPRVDTTPNCGNILAGVGPFAIETRAGRGAATAHTRVRIYMVNTGMVSRGADRDARRQVNYERQRAHRRRAGHRRADPHRLSRHRRLGLRELLPTGNIADVIDGVRVTCIDNGMPVVVMRADDAGHAPATKRADALNAERALKARVEKIRLRAGPMMNLGDVTKKVVPKMSLVAPPRAGGAHVQPHVHSA